MGIPREYYKEILLLSRSFEDSLSILYGAWSKAMHDRANSDATFVDSVSNAHAILKGCKGTVYNIGGWMAKVYPRTKDKTKSCCVESVRFSQYDFS